MTKDFIISARSVRSIICNFFPGHVGIGRFSWMQMWDSRIQRLQIYNTSVTNVFIPHITILLLYFSFEKKNPKSKYAYMS